MTKENLYREARKLVDIFNIHGNCIVPSIHEDKRDTTALERLDWIVNKAKEDFDLSIADIEEGIANLDTGKPLSFCIVCGQPFKEGDMLQAFLRCPDDLNGSWTLPALVDKEYQKRSAINKDNIRRKHSNCIGE